MRRNQGITLIALIITIIVLLILAGISIATLTGQNGLLTKASIAGEETKKAEYKEVLELIENGLRPEKVLEQLSAEEFINRYQEEIEAEIKKGTTLEGATVEKKDETTLWLTTKEGYVYEITEEKVELLGQMGKNPPPDLQETDIDFKLNPTGYTNQNVTVEIKPIIKIEGYTLQYSKDGNEWNNYTEKITYTENGVIYARLLNPLDEPGGAATKTIDRIDKEEPNKASINFNQTTVEVGNGITATVTQTDKGPSGIDITKCKWVYNSENKEIGKNASSYTGGTFKTNQKEIKLNIATPGTYYLHILTVDKAGNAKETISSVITIKKPPTVEDLKNGNEVNYTAKNGNTIKCKVLWDANSSYGKNGVQIIAMSSVETVSLGNSTTSWSTSANIMNNSISTLNSKATTYMNSTFCSGARCVGSKPDNPAYENTAQWPRTNASNTYLRGSDENYVTDEEQMTKLGIANIGTGYWLASRGVRVDGSKAEIGVRWHNGSSVQVNSGGFSTINGSGFWTANGTMWGGPTHGFRPVFTLKPEIKIVNNAGIYSLSI